MVDGLPRAASLKWKLDQLKWLVESLERFLRTRRAIWLVETWSTMSNISVSGQNLIFQDESRIYVFGDKNQKISFSMCSFRF